MKKSTLLPLLMATLLSPMGAAASGSYCAAIRGNGEQLPAHWGAMASLVEDQGLPVAMAGGSSATITMFLIESLSQNPLLQTNSEKALMIKSFQGYLEALSQTAEGTALQSILADKSAFQAILASGAKIDEALKKPENSILLAKHLESLKVLMASQDLQDILNPDFVLYVQRTSLLAKNSTPDIAPVLSYRSAQVSHALKNFGKFNSQTDKTLFFRPGLVNFERLGLLFGKMANFYANYNNESPAGKKIEERLHQFLSVCTPGSENLSWRELNEKRPECRQLFGSAVLMYQAASATSAQIQNRAEELVGSHIPTFATTSVLTGEAVEQYAQLYVAYQTTSDVNFGDQFKVNQKDLHFGYWGPQAALEKVQNIFETKPEFQIDPKTQKFLSLGATPWIQALAASPAEPGLSRIIALNRTQLSAGGWSDLHPTLILKAHGCEKIIYITRKGGESMFAQGIFKRLTNADGFEWSAWENLSPQARNQKNAQGNPADTRSTWSQFFNIANPQSSIYRSYKAADKIKCTSWDQFDAKTDMNGSIEDAMRAPLINGPYCR